MTAGASTTTVVVDPDRLATLEEERSFLLRSLRDLDAEQAAGDVDEDDYVDAARRLHQARRRRHAGDRRGPRPPATAPSSELVAAARRRRGDRRRRRRRRRGSSPVVGDRLAGDEITGDLPGDGVASMLAEARLLRATDPVAAMELYGDVLEAATRPRRGADVQRLAAAVGRPRSRPTRRSSPTPSRPARQKLNDAVVADPAYADPHCYLVDHRRRVRRRCRRGRRGTGDLPRARSTRRRPRPDRVPSPPDPPIRGLGVVRRRRW